MTAFQERDHGFVRVVDQGGDRKICGRSRLLAMSQPIHYCHEQTVRVRLHQVLVA